MPKGNINSNNLVDIKKFWEDVHDYKRRNDHYYKDIAEIVGMDPKTIAAWFRERRYITLPILIILSQYADLDIEKYRKFYHGGVVSNGEKEFP